MKLGPLNRTVRLFIDSPLVGVGGAVNSRLLHVKYLPATLGAIDNKDSIVASRDGNTVAMDFTTRFTTLDQTRTYFCDFEKRRYRVAHWRELGRREGLVITCRAEV